MQLGGNATARSRGYDPADPAVACKGIATIDGVAKVPIASEPRTKASEPVVEVTQV